MQPLQDRRQDLVSHKALEKPQGLNSLSQQTLVTHCHVSSPAEGMTLPGSNGKAGGQVLVLKSPTAGWGDGTREQNSAQPGMHLRSEQSTTGVERSRRTQLCWEGEGSVSEGMACPGCGHPFQKLWDWSRVEKRQTSLESETEV